MCLFSAFLRQGFIVILTSRFRIQRQPIEFGNGGCPIQRLGNAGVLEEIDCPELLHIGDDLSGELFVAALDLAPDDGEFVGSSRIIDPVIKATTLQGVMHFARPVGRHDHDWRLDGLHRSEFGDRHLEIREHFEQERLEGLVRAVEFIDQEDGCPAGLALLVYLSGHTAQAGGAIGAQVVKIALAKQSLPWHEAFFRGVLCNVLVCLAVWMAMAGRSVVDKAVAVVPPVAAFVAAGFEHSIANMYFFPLAMLVQAGDPALAVHPVTWSGLGANLLPVIAGNLLGGSVLVAMTYQVVYRRASAA